MAITINWATQVINIPQADLTNLGGGIYELDIDQFRLDLKDIEDGEEGSVFLDTHRHVAPVSVGGVTLARVVEIINGYTVTFENGTYAVNLVGANSNISDVANVNNVSVRSANSAGLIQVSGSGGATAADVWQHAIEGGLTAEQIVRIMLGALSGTTVGVGTSNEKFKSNDGTKDRIDATYDAQGNRSTVNLDGS